MKFLIVDDHKEFREVLKRRLNTSNDEVFEVEETSRIVQVYAQHRPDLVLMDVRVPPVNSLEATKLLKASYPEAHIIIVTQYDDNKFIQRATEVGAEAFVSKADLSPLFEKIKTNRFSLSQAKIQ